MILMAAPILGDIHFEAMHLASQLVKLTEDHGKSMLGSHLQNKGPYRNIEDNSKKIAIKGIIKGGLLENSMKKIPQW